MNFSSIVVPVQVDAAVFLTGPIFVDHIEFLQYVDKMLRVFLAYILNPIIVYN